MDEHPLSQEFEIALKLITICTKYNPNFLTSVQNFPIIDIFRKRWESLSTLNLDNLTKVSLIQLRKIYTKIQKCLLAYCRSEKANIHILFDLIKGYTYQSLIDLTSTKTFFCVEIPEKFSLKKKQLLLDTAIDKLNSSKSTYEQKYMIFELAFMPNILKYADNKELFNQLITKKMISNFMNTFFQRILV